MMHRPQSVMLFAAGFGTRMAPLTDNCPKPLIKVDGKPLIDHALDLVREISPHRIVANTHYLADQMADHLAPLGVTVSPEFPEILDTGGGLRAALPLLGDGPVFTMNTDAIWSGPNPLAMLSNAWDSDRMDGLLICIPIGQTIGHSGTGDFLMGETGQISRGPGWVYGGLQIIKPDLLHDIPEDVFSMNMLWDMLLKRKTLFGLSYPGRWCDVGHPGGIKLAEDMLHSTDV